MRDLTALFSECVLCGGPNDGPLSGNVRYFNCLNCLCSLYLHQARELGIHVELPE